LKQELATGSTSAYGLAGLAELAVTEGEFEQAVRLLAAADAACAAVGRLRCPPAERENDARLLAVARAAIGAVAFEAAWSEGQAWPLDRLIGEASGGGGSDEIECADPQT
jgi:hypothetical protein